MTDFSPEAFEKRFHELSAKRVAFDAKLEPLREERDAIIRGDTDLSVKAAIKRRETLDEKIEALQKELAPIETERALMARAIGGKTGVPKGMKFHNEHGKLVEPE